jgi:hypothetical protein
MPHAQAGRGPQRRTHQLGGGAAPLLAMPSRATAAPWARGRSRAGFASRATPTPRVVAIKPSIKRTRCRSCNGHRGYLKRSMVGADRCGARFTERRPSQGKQGECEGCEQGDNTSSAHRPAAGRRLGQSSSARSASRGGRRHTTAVVRPHHPCAAGLVGGLLSAANVRDRAVRTLSTASPGHPSKANALGHSSQSHTSHFTYKPSHAHPSARLVSVRARRREPPSLIGRGIKGYKTSKNRRARKAWAPGPETINRPRIPRGARWELPRS